MYGNIYQEQEYQVQTDQLNLFHHQQQLYHNLLSNINGCQLEFQLKTDVYASLPEVITNRSSATSLSTTPCSITESSTNTDVNEFDSLCALVDKEFGSYSFYNKNGVINNYVGQTSMVYAHQHPSAAITSYNMPSTMHQSPTKGKVKFLSSPTKSEQRKRNRSLSSDSSQVLTEASLFSVESMSFCDNSGVIDQDDHKAEEYDNIVDKEEAKKIKRRKQLAAASRASRALQKKQLEDLREENQRLKEEKEEFLKKINNIVNRRKLRKEKDAATIQIENELLRAQIHEHKHFVSLFKNLSDQAANLSA